MRKKRRGQAAVGCGLVLAALLSANVWADGAEGPAAPVRTEGSEAVLKQGWEAEDGCWYYYENGVKKADAWFYDDKNNAWYYFDKRGAMCQGRLEIAGDVYFFGEDGKMLTGWIFCPEDRIPQAFGGSSMEDDVYYCGSDGKMAVGWAEAMAPEAAAAGQSEWLSLMGDHETLKNWYCFQKNGEVYYNTFKKIGDNRYVFGEDGVYLKGWIYDLGEGNTPRYVKVDDDTSDSDKALYALAPENYMFGLWDNGALAVSRWFDARKPEDDEDADTRSFYADATGHIATKASSGHGATISAKRKARKVEEIGTYRFEDWSTDVNLMRIEGNLYCVEDCGTRIDGMIYLSGGTKGEKFPNGFYCFMDNSAMRTGRFLEENKDDDRGSDGYCYYYYFSEKTTSDCFKGQGFTGVDEGRLYYQGLAVAAQEQDWEVVYLPTLAEKRDYATGMFLVDEQGMVKKGSSGGNYCTSSDGNRYKIVKEHDSDEDYGYHIYIEEKDVDENKILIPVTSEEAEYIYWDEVEE